MIETPRFRVVLRALGHGEPIRASFIDPRTQREYPIAHAILPDLETETPCWYVLSPPPGVAEAQLHLLDVFYRWTFAPP